MPEWPDLHVVRGRIAAALTGRRVVAVRTGDPVVLRTTRPIDELLVGRRLAGVRHRGKFLLFDLDDGSTMVVNPMLSGVFALVPAGATVTKDTRLRLEFEGGDELRYRDDTRMGKIYLGVEAPGLAETGPEAGAPGWTSAEFAVRAKARRMELRNLLMDQRFIGGIGNAYVDEILWEARLHPKRRIGSLNGDEMVRFHDSLNDVIARGTAEVERAMPPALGTKPRDHMRVRGRAGTPCPRCGVKIRRSRSGLNDLDLCPGCQPAPKGQLF
ncbi:MAG: DNA-formamidopyrimidine glycosylase [Candidatus Limnocylindrales bacterium]